MSRPFLVCGVGCLRKLPRFQVKVKSGTGCVTPIPHLTPPSFLVGFIVYEYGSTARVTVNDEDMTVFAPIRNTALHIHPQRRWARHRLRNPSSVWN